MVISLKYVHYSSDMSGIWVLKQCTFVRANNVPIFTLADIILYIGCSLHFEVVPSNRLVEDISLYMNITS
jgi:hypothetical protein